MEFSVCKTENLHTPKEVFLIAYKSPIPAYVLSLLFDAGCMSKRAFDTIPFSLDRTSQALNKMMDNQLITRTGPKGQWRYTLLEKGKSRLAAHNPIRYTTEMPFSPNQFYQSADRAVARGDVAALMSQACYSIHPHDKPAFPAHTPFDQPGCRSPTSPDDRTMLLSNQQEHCYASADVPDDTIYRLRTTPVNCYYDVLEIKRFVADQHVHGMAGVKNSRICGIAFTPDYLFRTLYSMDKSLQLKNTGERNVADSIENLFTGYLPPYRHGVLLVGDRRFRTALRLLENSLAIDKTLSSKQKKEKAQLLNTWNAGRPVFYLALNAQSLTMLRMMQYPGWESGIRELAAKLAFREARLLRGDGIYHYRGDGKLCYIGVDLNLTSFSQLLLDRNEDAMTLLCLDWQKSFYEEAFKLFDPYMRLDVELRPLPDSFLSQAEEALERGWEVKRLGSG